jgi:hypothetical protein
VRARGPARGLIEDRRVPPPMPFLAQLQKLILNDPWLSEDTSDPARLQKLGFVLERGRGRLSPAEWKALSAAYQARVAGMRRSPQRRSGR